MSSALVTFIAMTEDLTRSNLRGDFFFFFLAHSLKRYSLSLNERHSFRRCMVILYLKLRSRVDRKWDLLSDIKAHFPSPTSISKLSPLKLLRPKICPSAEDQVLDT